MNAQRLGARIVIALLVLALAGSGLARSDDAPLVTAHLVVAPASAAFVTPEPSDIVAGPDGALWFAAKSLIGRITPAGEITRFAVPAPYVAESLIAAADGSFWFVAGEHALGRITGSGVFAFFKVDGANQVGAMTLGPDGNLWFTDTKNGAVGRLSASGRITRLFKSWPSGFDPIGIATGPDKRLWITDYDNNKIVAMTLAGRTQTFATPTKRSRPTIIEPGKDGNLWFVESNADQIGRITVAGKITEFPLASHGGRDPKYNPRPGGIAWGADGNVWFTGGSADMIRRLSPNGAIKDFLTKSTEVTPEGIVAGPDGNLWFTERDAAQIGKISVDGAMTEFPLVTEQRDAYVPALLAPAANGGLWLSRGSSEPSIGLLSSSGEFHELTRKVSGNWLTAGPDGSAWFITDSEDKIGNLTAGGTLTEYAIPKSKYAGLAIAPDGAAWLADMDGNKIIRVTLPGATVTEYPLRTPRSTPRYITVDAGGNAWFSEYLGNKIGRITPGGSLTEFPIPVNYPQLGQVAVDPRGTAWFVETGSSGSLGSISPTGKVSEIKMPHTSIYDGPACVVVDHSGTVWFGLEGYPNSYVGRLVNGKPVMTPIPTPQSFANICALGGDGNMWFVVYRHLVGAGSLAKVSPTGAVTEYRLR